MSISAHAKVETHQWVRGSAHAEVDTPQWVRGSARAKVNTPRPIRASARAEIDIRLGEAHESHFSFTWTQFKFIRESATRGVWLSNVGRY